MSVWTAEGGDLVFEDVASFTVLFTVSSAEEPD